jgi:hypothetical protein
LPGISQFCELVTFVVTWPVAERSASGQLETFVEQFVYWPDGGQRPAVLTAHPANGDQQSQLAVDGLPLTPWAADRFAR